MINYAVGVDVGGMTVKLGLFDGSGNLLEKWAIPTRVEHGGKNILPDTASSILEKLEERGIPKSSVHGIGIGIPGPVTEDGKTKVAVNLHWGEVDICGDLESLTGIRTVAANDANLAALGEQWKGAGKGCNNVLLVTLGTGIGGGVVINSHIVPGAHGAGGEIGHITVDENFTIRCNCGKFGCLEQFASATAVRRIANEKLAESDRPSLLRDCEVEAKLVFDAAKQGDPLSIEVVEEFGYYLAKGISMVTCVLDPEIIVIGGGVSRAGQVVIDLIKKYYPRFAFTVCADAEFTLAALGNEAGIYGAARLALE